MGCDVNWIFWDFFFDTLSRLERNQISDEGARAIAEALKSNTTLTLLE